MAGVSIAAAPTSITGFEDASAKRARFLIFLLALALRLTAGGLFFGAVDIVNSAKNCMAILEGKTVALPYFPTINMFFWLGGVLAATLPIPFALGLKLVPILFDSLLAVLIRDLVARIDSRIALWAGLLYAASPVALLIISFHGQWDSIALFFLLLAFGVREGNSSPHVRGFLFGSLFSISLLAKPIALPFLLLLLRRKRETAQSEWATVAGLALTFSAAFGLYAAYGYSVSDTLIGITSYSAKGVQVFGLPFAPLLAKLSLQSYRLLWALPVMIALAVLYHRGKVTATDAMLLFYLFTLATTGLSPQYLLWPVPLLLVSQRLRIAGVYTAIAMLFLLPYYMNPWASYFAFENLSIFAPLRGLAWLLPPAVLAKRELLPWVQTMGNVVLPACALAIAWFVFKGRREPAPENRWSVRRTAGYTAPAFLIGAAILVLKLTIDEQHVRARVLEIWRAIPAQYAMHVQSGSGSVIFVGDFGNFELLNVVVLLALLTTIWCAAAAANSPRQKSRNSAY